jgi:hypothetical protein
MSHGGVSDHLNSLTLVNFHFFRLNKSERSNGSFPDPFEVQCPLNFGAPSLDLS